VAPDTKLPDMEVILGKGYGTDVRVYVLSQKWRQVQLDPYTLIRDALHDELNGDPAILKISYCWPMTPKEYEKLKGTLIMQSGTANCRPNEPTCRKRINC